MRGSLDLDEQRLAYIAGGAGVAPGRVRPAVLASWERCRAGHVDPDRVAATLSADESARLDVVAAAETVFAAYQQMNPSSGCALVLFDAAGTVRARRDCGAPALSRMLDDVLLVPGYLWSESAVGTTAASIALAELCDAEVAGAEHYVSRLRPFAEAAAVVHDPDTGEVCATILLTCHESSGSSLLLPLARLLAGQVVECLNDIHHGHVRQVFDIYARTVTVTGGWVLAGDGDYLVTGRSARGLPLVDQAALGDVLTMSAALEERAETRVELTGGCADVTTEPVRVSGQVVGCVLLASPTQTRPVDAPPNATRRQGSHVAPTVRRDFAKDVRSLAGGNGATRPTRLRSGVGANRALLSPFAAARFDVARNIQQRRNQLVVGESGVGKRTLVLSQFLQTHPGGGVTNVDCSTLLSEPGAARSEVLTRFEDLDGGAHLLLLSGLNTLTPVDAHRLDETLGAFSVLPTPPVIGACVDTAAVDATRPYGLVLRHFDEIARVPPLRSRIEEVGELALALLGRIAAGRSLRLSHQVVRVLEGYAWPGNVSELEDVLRYVIQRKPVGEIQPPDLPPVCFQRRPRRLSMLEAAQCDAIIQALYESRGNRYKAAAMLGIARSSLYRKIDAFGISYIA